MELERDSVSKNLSLGFGLTLTRFNHFTWILYNWIDIVLSEWVIQYPDEDENENGNENDFVVDVY